MKNNKVEFLVGAIFSLSERRNGLRPVPSTYPVFQRRRYVAVQYFQEGRGFDVKRTS